MSYSSEFIEIVLIEEKPKTSVYCVYSKSGGYPLGTIKWLGGWRQYVFYPESETVWNSKCLDFVVDFIKDLMDKRKVKK